MGERATMLPMLLEGPAVSCEGRWCWAVHWVTETQLFSGRRERTLHKAVRFTRRGAERFAERVGRSA